MRKNTIGNTFTFPSAEVRALPFPDPSVSDGSSRAKRITLFASVDDIPEDLVYWTQVNPRTPIVDKKHGKLKGVVARRMVETLLSSPDTFVLKNIGIFLLAKDVVIRKEPGGGGFLDVTLESPELHGIVNGGHTLRAILEARRETNYTPGAAFVAVHVMVGIDPIHVVDMAEGLNRSLQVDDPSLANLGGTFDRIKEVLRDRPGADQIAYSQGDDGDVDILFVLTLMSLFDLERFPDRKIYPNRLFGQHKAVLGVFEQDEDRGFPIFGRIIERLPEILVLADRVQKLAFERDSKFGLLKVSNAKTQNRAGSPKNKGQPAYFAGGTVNGKMHLGWLLPMVGAFRANVSLEAWKGGEFRWIADNTRLLENVIVEMAEIVKQQHQDNKGKPAEVGRKEAAYRLCYSAVSLELAQSTTGVAPR